MEDNLPLIANERNTEVEHDNNEKNVDQVLTQAGGFGRFQLALLLACMLVNISYAGNSTSMYFAADDPSWNCTTVNSTLHQNASLSMPQSSDNCKSRCQLSRDEWNFTTSKTYSIVTEFDLICAKQYLKSLSASAVFIGAGIGSIVFGPIADIYGRKITINIVTLILAIGSIASVFVNTAWQFICLRGLVGVAFGGSEMCLYILLSEFTTLKARGVVANVYFLAFTMSQLVITALAYYVREWRRALLYYSILPFVSLVITLMFYESPNWLNAKGQSTKAYKVLLRVARINQRSIHDVTLKAPIKDAGKASDKKYSYYHLVNTRKVFVLVLVQCFLWLSIGLMFYGIAFESSSLGGDIYLNFVLSSMADLPGYVAVIITSVYVSRKKTVCTCFLLGSALLCGIGLTPANLVSARVALAVSSRVLLSIAYNSVYLWTFEIFPTVLRSQGMNVCQIASRVGSAVAPFINDGLKSVVLGLPFFIMAGVGVISAVLGMLLPETFNKPTRQSYEDLLESPMPVRLTDDEHED